jgi:hypothetical protein
MGRESLPKSKCRAEDGCAMTRWGFTACYKDFSYFLFIFMVFLSTAFLK